MPFASAPGGATPTPIAIVGIGCRLPGGVVNAESFWRLLSDKRSAIGEVPPDRWNLARYFHPDRAAAGGMASRWGGFIDTLSTFDARFWGISPREAVRMDPQQRWLLEVAWEAIEDAGVAPAGLRSTSVGVFVGISGNDHGGLQLNDPEQIDAYVNSGNTASIASNRISYMLDLRGPSVSVDTACSSSLVAVSLACDSLWSGRCDAALAGGVNALISPAISVGFSKASMLSPSGRCFSFDARADGYVRAEGAGMVLLKPLARALADGDRIYAVVLGTAVNQDGHTSSMTVPSVDGQEAMLRAAYAQAGVAPSRVAYVEAHGTGTPVGDPIEATALGRVVGHGRSSADRCPIGSLKTNIGHLESASGIAGLIKAALVAYHCQIPASLNYERPNPQIAFEALGLTVAADAAPLLARDDEPAVVGVNSFGFGGTNAHVVLQSPPAAPATALDARAFRTPAAPANRPVILPVSARDDSALRACVERYRERLADSTTSIADLCAAAGTRKDHHSHRLALVGDSREALRTLARLWLRDGHSAAAVSGRIVSDARPVFVFTGQGAQWWAMGRGLLRSEPLVRERVEAIDATLRTLAGWSLIEELERDEATSRIDRTDIAQPALFALQVALCDLWRSWGIEPAAVVGHSVGEVAAAYCAGIYDFETAIAIIFHRSRLQQRTQGLGRMLAAAIDVDEARRLMQDVERVEIAAINSATLVTLSGDRSGLEDVERVLRERGVFTRWMRIEYAFHSYQMDPLRAELLESLAGIEPRPSTLPLVSTVSGVEARGPALDAHYWWANVRHPVQFAAAISTLVRDGHDLFLEIGPHPALETAINQTLAAHDTNGAVFHSLRREADDLHELMATVAALYARGATVDWRAVNRGSGAFVPLPQYPWQRESFWFEPPASAHKRLSSPIHPLLGTRSEAALPTWDTSLDLHRLSYLAEHRVWDRAVFPASAFAEIGLAVAAELFPDDSQAIEDLAIHAALFLSKDTPTRVQVVFSPEDRRFSVYSAGSEPNTWQLHGSGRLSRDTTAITTDTTACDRLRRTGRFCSHEEYRRQWAMRGYQFGPSFQLVDRMWYGDDEALIEIAVPAALEHDHGPYLAHPAVLDACFHLFLGLQMSRDDSQVDGLYLPESIQRLRLHQPMRATRLMAHGWLISDDREALVAQFHVTDADARPVATIEGFRATRVEVQRQDVIDDCFYQLEWEPRHLRGSQADGTCGFPGSDEIVRAVRTASTDIGARYGLDDYHLSRAAEDETICRLVLSAFVELGWHPRVGSRFTLDELLTTLGIVEEHRLATRQLLRDVTSRGWLRNSATDTWEVLRAPARLDAATVLDALAAVRPDASANVELLRLVMPRMAAVLKGDIDARTLLFPNGSTEPLERFYLQGMALPAHLDAFRVALSRVLADLPRNRAVRVLEVGAGTGAVTRTVLSVLPVDRTEYVFTDVGQAFLAAARRRFADYGFIEYQTFDIEKDPSSQGIAGRFDLILAGDVLHTAADLRDTLGRLRQCLAPGGLLMFIEIVTRDFPLLDATFGLLGDWWRAADHQLRPESPLLEREQWLALLSSCGFDAPRTVSCTRDQLQAEHATFVAFRGASPAPADEAPAGGQRFLLLADSSGVAEALAAELSSRGHHAHVTRSELFDACGDFAGIVDCRHLDRPHADALTLETLHAAQDAGLLRAFELIQAVADRSTPIWFVTRNVHAATPGDRVDGLASAPLIGLARVANTEHQCRFFMVDLDDCAATDAARHLVSEITLPRDGEFETAYRTGVRHAVRLRRTAPDAFRSRTIDAVAADGTQHAFRLQSDKPGVLANLAIRRTARPAPRPHEIEVRVRAGGLNFRDVMKALGTLPVVGPERFLFGDDFAGVVERVGADVTAFTPGDEVVGMASSAFRSFAITDARFAFAKRPDHSFEDAATLPTAFLTAHYALAHVGRMQPGERILIHAGAGGVGLAAIQIARQMSLEIFATAGTPEKRALLERLGVPHVMNSRTLDFADQVMAITGGRGVDAVLNSLAGEFIPKSLSTLAPFGRFLEIGKADVFKDTKIGLRPLRNNISYSVIDLTQHVVHKPDVVGQMLTELAGAFASGALQPLPYTAFPISDAVGAFRHMAQGKHVGKNVLTFDPHDVRIGFNTEADQLFRADASYLITGGAGGFGLGVASWIAAHGGRHILLMSRSGPNAEAQGTIDRLRSTGVTIAEVRGDATSASDVQRIIEVIAGEFPPLKGVFHAAMVMDDEFVAKQDRDRVRRVLAPKMAGAWNLHVATIDHDLEHFVNFSSFSNVIGVPKQASYNAGNAFLDQLAHFRRAQGLPALSINFGVLLGAGFVERDRRTGDALANLGIDGFQLDEATAALERLLFADVTQAVAARVDWNDMLRLSPLAATATTYQALVGESREAESQGSLVARLREAAQDHRARLVQDFIATQVGGVFGMAEDRIDRSASLTTLGLDSLMILELTNRVEREIGIRLPMASLLSGPTVVELGQIILRLLAPTLAADVAPHAGAVTRAPELRDDAAARAPETAALDSAGHVLPLLGRGLPAPIFAFHPVGGGVGIYAAMGPRLGPHAALYGVESRLKRGADRDYATLDEMVERYAAAVREVSEPPYRLFGFSLGGYVAARVAERLEAEGLDVEAVGVVDWGVTHTATRQAQREALIQLSIAGYRFAQEDIGLVRALTLDELHDQISPIVDAILGDGANDAERFWDWIVERRLVVSPALEIPARQQLTRFEQHCLLLSQPCPLPRFDAPLAVWRAARGFGSGLEAWQHRGSMNREYTLDADHNAIVRPDSLQVIAAQLAEFLADRAPVPTATSAGGRNA